MKGVAHMRTRVTSGIVAAITALALTVPATGFAHKGGVPTKPSSSCKAHTKGKHKDKGKSKGDTKNAAKGRKCG
jgi:hypothetical protein